MTDKYPRDLDEDLEALEDGVVPVQAEIGEAAEAVSEEWSTIVRFRGNPLSRELDAGAGVPADTILGHLANMVMALASAIYMSEDRIADGGNVTQWVPLTLTDAKRLHARIEAVRLELVECFDRQAMLDTSAHADNLPI